MRTICLFNESLFSSYNRELWRGALKAARERGYRLLTLNGTIRNVYGTDLDSVSPDDSQSDLLLRTTDSGLYDGILFWGSMLNHGQDSTATQEFIRSFSNRPCFSIGLSVPGVPSLLFDNYAGMRLAVEHLIDEHGCRKIAYFAGNDYTVQFEIEERYRAYRNVIRARGIAFDPLLVVEPKDVKAFQERQEKQAKPVFSYTPIGDCIYRILFDDRGLVPGRDIDAICCHDDWSALEVIRAIKDHDGVEGLGLRIVSFDDAPEAIRAIPSLTTVRQNIFDQGKLGCELLIRIIEGDTVPELNAMEEPRLIVRESCGCSIDHDDSSTPAGRLVAERARLEIEAAALELLDASVAIVSRFDLEGIMEHLAHHLPQLGIPGCFIALYDDPARPSGGATLVFGYARYAILAPKSDWESFEASKLLPPSCMDSVADLPLVVEALHFKDMRMGFVVFAVGTEEGMRYYTLKTMLSTALHGRRLILENRGQEKALFERETLLKEIHHRVKNNFQIISSLFNLQLMSMEIPEVQSGLIDIKERIHAMALIHERLYRSKDFSSISFDEYLSELTHELYLGYSLDPRRISLEVDARHVELDLDRAIPCGLIVNELITNALKYAFPSKEKKGASEFRV